MPLARLRVVVVGAGPYGLAVAAMLRASRVPVTLLERGTEPASNWATRYDGLRLNTVRHLSHLPGRRIPRRAGMWVGRDDFRAYLHDYATDLDVRTGVEVHKITWGNGCWWLDTTDGGAQATCVVVATGAFDRPAWPDTPDLRRFGGEVVHAADFRSAAAYRDRRVLVVGGGASGLEIAALLAEAGAAEVDLAVRSCQNLFTRTAAGLPLTPPPVVNSLPAGVLDIGGRLTQRLLGHDWPAPLPRPAAGLGTALRRDGREPIVADGIMASLQAARVRLRPGVTGVCADALTLDDGTRVQPDLVIAATGYQHGLRDLVGDLDVLDAAGAPHSAKLPGLVFAGFAPGISGRLVAVRGQARRAAQTVLRALR